MRLRRVPFALVAVTGLGAFVALAVGVTLYFSAVAGMRSTQALISEQAQAHVDALEHRLEARLAPVSAQAGAIANAFETGRIALTRTAELDAFMAGALSATPQLHAIGIVDANARVRRWERDAPPVSEDWSGRRDVQEWLAEGVARSQPGWRAPLWTPAERIAALLYDMPLRQRGQFTGMLGEVVSIATLSEELAQFATEHRVVPFILYGEDQVLAHPALAGRLRPGSSASPLVPLAELGDPVLARLRTERSAPLGLRALHGAVGGHVVLDGEPYLYVEREIRGYGLQPWRVGVYFDPVEGGQRAQMLRMLASIGAGLAVLLAAVAAAALVGRRLARPVEALARAAAAVRAGRLDDVPVVPRSAIAELDEARRSFGEMVEGLRERRFMRETLGQFVPEQVAQALLASRGRLEPVEARATILMCDIENFTALTESLGPHRVFEFLNAYFETIVGAVERYGGIITQFQGDAILAVFNLPLEQPDYAAQALRAALDIVRECDAQPFAGVSARNRIGLATGRVVAGAVGSPGRLSYTVHGNAVNLSARIEALNKDYGTRILVSEKTAELCEGFALRRVGEAHIRGYPDPVGLYTPA